MFSRIASRRLWSRPQDALAQTLVEQQEQDGEGDVSGGRSGALLGDDSDADADMQDDDDRPPSRAGSGMTASTSVHVAGVLSYAVKLHGSDAATEGATGRAAFCANSH